MGDVEKFEDFLRRAKAELRPSVAEPTCAEDEFREFARRALPLVVGEVRQELDDLHAKLITLGQWKSDHDLIDVAGYRSREDSYTELIRWALDPGTHSPSARERQQAWLTRLGLPDLEEAATPITQLATAHGRPDLVLRYPGFAVVHEAKTGSAEHFAAASGELQTVIYPSAVRHALGASADFPVYMIYLTTDRSQAANPAAIRESYVGFAVSLAQALPRAESLDSSLRWAFAMLITHLTNWAVPDELAGGDLIWALTESSASELSDEWLVRHLNELAVLLEVLRGTHRNA